MTLTEINNLVIDGHFLELSIRIIPNITFTDVQITDNTYIGVTVSSGFTKPTLAEYEAEFLVYKQELTDAENARIVEVARVKDITDRFRAISNIHDRAQRIGKHQPNMEIELLRIINEDDQITLSELEAEDAAQIIVETKNKRNNILNELRKIRIEKLKAVDVMINDLSLGIRTDKQAVIDYRQALKDVTTPYIKVNGDPKASVDLIDLNNYVWPIKP